MSRSKLFSANGFNSHQVEACGLSLRTLPASYFTEQEHSRPWTGQKISASFGKHSKQHLLDGLKSAAGMLIIFPVYLIVSGLKIDSLYRAINLGSITRDL